MSEKACNPNFGASDFRRELLKIMPGYKWTVHKTGSGYFNATGIQSSGFNRLSTLSVVRLVRAGAVQYEVKSAGYGTRAKWLHTNADKTLASALRGLQQHYEQMANKYRSHAASMQRGRAAEEA